MRRWNILKVFGTFPTIPPPFVSQRVSLSFILTTGRLTSRDLHAHSHRRWCRKMRGLFCKSDKYTCQGSNAPVYCLPVLPLGKKKNNLLLINKGHWRVCRATWQLALPLNWQTLFAFKVSWDGRHGKLLTYGTYGGCNSRPCFDCSLCSTWNIASRLQASKNVSGCISYKCCEYIMHSIVCMNPFTC